MKKKEEEMKMWMRKPKKALDIYRLAISTIFIFILAVLLVATATWAHFIHPLFIVRLRIAKYFCGK